jgi:tetratricopeptide (TPR) repeat protein
MPKLDSTIAEYRIKLLRNDWPFIDPKLKRGYYEVCKPNDWIDTLAVRYLLSEISWGQAQEGTTNWFFRTKNLDQFLLHMEALLYQYPIIKENFTKLEEIAMGFLKEKDYARAAKVLHLERKLKPNAYAAKWIGQIELTSGRIESAIKYLEESLRFNPSDLQVKYNLAGSYALNKEYARSKEIIQQVLVKDSNYPGAQGLLNQLNGIK